MSEALQHLSPCPEIVNTRCHGPQARAFRLHDPFVGLQRVGTEPLDGFQVGVRNGTGRVLEGDIAPSPGFSVDGVIEALVKNDRVAGVRLEGMTGDFVARRSEEGGIVESVALLERREILVKWRSVVIPV